METRIYPIICMSGNCGGHGNMCKECNHYKAQQEFWQWVKEHKAIEKDHIWSPNVFTATR